MGALSVVGRAVIWGTAGAGVLGAKAAASHASAEGLRWLLVPTAALLDVAHVGRFDWIAGQGFLDADAHFLIAPACAGVNFLSAVFLSGVVGFAERVKSWRGGLLLLSASAASAYLCTLGANAVRIGFAIALHAHRSTYGAFLSEGDAHRLLGVVVYTGALILLYRCAHRAVDRMFHGG